MSIKMNGLGSPQGKAALTEEKLGCYRVWVRPKTTRKEARKRGHMMLGLFPFGTKK